MREWIVTKPKICRADKMRAEGSMSLWMKLMMVSLVAIPMVAQVQSPAAGAAPAQAAAAPKPATNRCDAMQKKLDDWPQLGRYAPANAALLSTQMGRVVFYGDSITDAWTRNGGSFFPGKPYINRGISGQTTPQMVLRFRQDVIDLKPRVVVILAGTNDIAGNTGQETPEEIEGYMTSMAELATANGIKVVLCSILPAYDYPWKPGLEPAPKILAINAWLKEYAEKHKHVYVDYHAAMKDGRDGLPATLSRDGVHPTHAGYEIMAPLAEAAIEKALK
jgi:acyl-CoA thioesterase I